MSSANVEIKSETNGEKKEEQIPSSIAKQVDESVKEAAQVVQQQEAQQKAQEEKMPAIIKTGKIFTEEPKLIEFGKTGGEGGKAAIINYNLPGSTTLHGRNYIILDVPWEYFHPQNALHEMTAAEEKVARTAEEARLAALALRKSRYDNYTNQTNAIYQNALQQYEARKSSLPTLMNQKVATIFNSLNNLERNVYNDSLYGQFIVWVFFIPINQTFLHVLAGVRPLVPALRAVISTLPPSQATIPVFRSNLLRVKDVANTIITQIDRIPHPDGSKRQAAINLLRPHVQDILSTADSILGLLYEYETLKSPVSPDIPTFEKWQASSEKSVIGANRMFPVTTNEGGALTDEDVLELPRSLRRIAVNRVFPNFKGESQVEAVEKALGQQGVVDRIYLTTTYPAEDQSHKGAPKPDLIAKWRDKGYKPRIIKSLSGEYFFEFVKDVRAEIDPKIVIIETNALSSFIGDYGAGATLQTFSLLPGEKTKITIKSFARTEETRKEASSVFDSASEDATSSFETSLEQESAVSAEQKKSDESHLNVKAEVAISVVKVGVDAGMSQSSSQSRTQSARSVSNVGQKHAAEKSSKRDVSVNESKEVKEEKSKEEGLEREIANVNLSRVLNFVFRQLNQAYSFINHLIDVKIGFSNGFPEDYIEVPLYAMDSILDKFLKDSVIPKEDTNYDPKYPDRTYAGFLKDMIIKSLQTVYDYKDRRFSIVEELPDPDDPTKPTGKYRFKRQLYRDFCLQSVDNDEVEFRRKFPDVAQGVDHNVEGIVVGLDHTVLRTDAVIVEALLGQGVALDGFALGVQEQALKEKILENDRMQMALDIINQKNMTPEQAKLAADLYYKIFGLTPMKQFAERTYPVIFPELKKTVQNLSVE